MTKQNKIIGNPNNPNNNCEGYADPTARQAIKERSYITNEASDVVRLLKNMAELAGFEFVGRFVIQHKKTGKTFH